MGAEARTARFRQISAGDPAPWFHQRSGANPRFAFDTAAGRYVVLCFFVSAAAPQSRAALDAVEANRQIFDDQRLCFFGVTLDPADEAEGRVREAIPGRRVFYDYDGTVSRLYGCIPQDAKPGEANVATRQIWVVLDPTLRVVAAIPFAPDGRDRGQVFDLLRALPDPAMFAGMELQAPILFLPNVFEPELCRQLVEFYEREGGVESGFMREVDGKTVPAHDAAHKRRKDVEIADEALRGQLRARIHRRIVPEIRKVHQFTVSRMERYIVACYAAEDGGHFRAHRDNTTKGTAHRRFAVSINLNDAFEGGRVSFPEYGPRSFKPPPGGAVVFSCSLLHAVSKVTAGRRYAFLPFLYDDEAARLREENQAFMAEGGGYKA